jgi:hypothetical protein
LLSSVVGFLSVTTAVDRARAFSVISAVYGFSTFVHSSSATCFSSVADLPAAASGSAVSGVLVLLAVSCQVSAKFGIAPSWV